MTKAYLAWFRYIIIGSLGSFAIAGISVTLLNSTPIAFTATVAVLTLSLVFISVILTKRLAAESAVQFFDDQARQQTEFLARFTGKPLFWLTFCSAALSLLLELSVIRWQSSSVDFLAFFKNFGLIACFAGLGLGYSLANARVVPIFFTTLFAAVEILYVYLLRVSAITLMVATPPLVEQATLRVAVADNVTFYWVAVYAILTFLFCNTALIFVPVGQLCGNLMSKSPPLRAYGTNLLGSLFGVILMTVLSFFWTPPPAWLGVCFVLCLIFAAYSARSALTTGISALVALMVLACPNTVTGYIIHSPYQLIETDKGIHGWLGINAAGYYYQRVMDLTKESCSAFPDLVNFANYYNLPYKISPKPKSVLIMGAGTGNDVAAALRAGAEHIDAVEIDPAIAELGKIYHPEKPYDDKRVNLILDDGRAFLRRSTSKYDVIVFALIDSHALSSSGSSLRVDSYIYTLESFNDARQHLNPGGLVSLSFTGVVPQLQYKVFSMLKKTFDGREPYTLRSNYDSSTSFFESNDPSFVYPKDLLQSTNFDSRTDLSSRKDDIDMSTDNWPFFYMLKKQFPFSYMPLVVLVFLLSFALISTLNKSRFQKSEISFFFLGAGFMLVETKAITELGLQFGNTWLVTANVVTAVISMAFLSNLAVAKFKFKSIILPAILLILSLAASAYICHHDGGSVVLDKWTMTAILTCPIIFSGTVFSVLFNKTKSIGSAMSMNIMGALCGALLEYNAIYLGYQALYYFAIVIYLLAFVSIKLFKDVSLPTDS